MARTWNDGDSETTCCGSKIVSVQTRFGTKIPTLCAVCRRRAHWIGYAPKPLDRIIWSCDDLICISLLKKVYRMPDAALEAFEHCASRDAMYAAGEYLQQIDQFNMAELTPSQLSEFRRRFVVTFECRMRERIFINDNNL